MYIFELLTVLGSFFGIQTDNQIPLNYHLPPMSERQTVQGRDDCINANRTISCESVQGEAYLKCREVRYQTETIIEPNGKQSDDCYEFDMFLSHCESNDKMPDVYYKCVHDAQPTA